MRKIVKDDEESQAQEFEGRQYVFRKDILWPCDDKQLYSLSLIYARDAINRASPG